MLYSFPLPREAYDLKKSNLIRGNLPRLAYQAI